MKLSYKKLIGVYTPLIAVAGVTLLSGAVSFEYSEMKEKDAVVSEGIYAQESEAGFSSFLTERDEYIATLEVGTREVVAAETPDEVESTEIEAEAVVVPDEWANRAMPKVNEFANIRSEANQESALLGKLPKGALAEVVERGEEWTKISSGSVTGFIKNEFLVFGEEAKQFAESTCPVMATVKTQSLRIRKEGSESAGVITLASEGQSFKVLEQGSEWVKIQYKENKEGFLAAAYVDVALQTGKAISVEEEAEAARKAEEAKRKAAEEAEAAKAKSVKVETVQGDAMNASVDETTLLAAVVQMEAGGQGYEGMLAVASVVMNRVNSGRYPGTITDVVYQKGQFPGAHNGILNKILSKGPRQDCIQVAQDAISGINNAAGYLGFCSTKSNTYKKYSTYSLIGSHYFY